MRKTSKKKKERKNQNRLMKLFGHARHRWKSTDRRASFQKLYGNQTHISFTSRVIHTTQRVLAAIALRVTFSSPWYVRHERAAYIP